MTVKGFVIAVDGPAASGKGTIATRLGSSLSLPVMDTGLLYRAVGMAATRQGMALDQAESLAILASQIKPDELESPDLRGRVAGEAASQVAVHDQVRKVLRAVQRQFASRLPGAILDGRDIGTVIAPDAAVKLFVTASPQVRAERRWKQLKAQGDSATYDQVLDDIFRRDERDAGRGSSPLKQAEDAVLLDTTKLDIESAFEAARRIVDTARARWSSGPG